MVFVSSSAHARYHQSKDAVLVPLADGTFDCVPTIRNKKIMVKCCKYCKKMLKSISTDKCPECASRLQRRCEWPTKEQLDRDIQELKTNVAIAKKYGVSDVTIAKWRNRLL